ncbi:flagellar protein FliT [Dyella humi]|uniref:Flagellar protein FliT n=1 Tax=Dyella humi TaxID=1770547 RepID=A0ABW8IN36_9GAMM
MNEATQNELQRALALTVEMIDAAARDNWTLVTELDAQRQVHLQQIQHDTLAAQHREALQTLQVHNRALLERAEQVRETVEQQLSQHQYNHRALRTYITSAG